MWRGIRLAGGSGCARVALRCALVHSGVAASAIVHPSATVETGAVVAAGAEISEHVTVGSGSVVGAGVVIGAGTRIGFNVTLQNCVIGANCLIHPGVVIGADGFGFTVDEQGRVIKKPQELSVRDVYCCGLHFGAVRSNLAVSRLKSVTMWRSEPTRAWIVGAGASPQSETTRSWTTWSR